MTGDKASIEMARKVLKFVLKPAIWSENADEKRYPGLRARHLARPFS